MKKSDPNKQESKNKNVYNKDIIPWSLIIILLAYVTDIVKRISRSSSGRALEQGERTADGT